MFDGNRVRGVVGGPKPFFSNEWEAPGTFPNSRTLPFLSSPDSSFEFGEQTRLTNMILLPIKKKSMEPD
jgi:hypothetical protein